MKIKIAFLSLCLSLAAIATAAAPQLFVWGSTNWERNRITRLEQSLNFSKAAMTSTWSITIIPGEDFQRRTEYLKINTASAYTFLQLRQTYLNEDYLIWHTDVEVRQTLGHEAGHLICECNSEQKANEIAYELQFK